MVTLQGAVAFSPRSTVKLRLAEGHIPRGACIQVTVTLGVTAKSLRDFIYSWHFGGQNLSHFCLETQKFRKTKKKSRSKLAHEMTRGSDTILSCSTLIVPCMVTSVGSEKVL